MQGEGTAASPFLISSMADLIEAKGYPDAHFRQTAAVIHLGNAPVGTFPLFTAFNGVYDGRLGGFRDFQAEGSVFGDLTGVVKNLWLDNFKIVGGGSPALAGFVARINTGLIECVSVMRCEFTIETNGYVEAGTIASQNAGTIRRCVTQGNRIAVSHTTEARVGGIVALNAGEIEDCAAFRNTLQVTDVRSPHIREVINESGVGGIAGRNIGSVARCLADNYKFIVPQPTTQNYGEVVPGDYSVDDCKAGYGAYHLPSGLLGYYTWGDLIRDTKLVYEYTGEGGYLPAGGSFAPEHWTLWKKAIHLSEEELTNLGTYAGWDLENVWTFNSTEKLFSGTSTGYPLPRKPLLSKGTMYVKDAGVWKKGVMYVKDAGVWKPAKEIIKL